uniref:Secreted peptide prohormone-10 n=1 Tax=Schmidtea mediterranea TaxID=79327 RepID=E3CTK3_SCHMD|nr:TPA_inf: secreted peptide prohormone-10 [Schmidtea mediterranea]
MNFQSKIIIMIMCHFVITVFNEPLSKYYPDNNEDLSATIKRGAEFFLQRVEGKRGAEFFLRRVVGKRSTKPIDPNQYPLVYGE